MADDQHQHDSAAARGANAAGIDADEARSGDSSESEYEEESSEDGGGSAIPQRAGPRTGDALRAVSDNEDEEKSGDFTAEDAVSAAARTATIHCCSNDCLTLQVTSHQLRHSLSADV